MKKAFLLLLLSLWPYAGNSQITIYTSDIDNYWTAYDSITKTQDFSKKVRFINDLYISKGTKGLRAFMWAWNYSDTLYVRMIDAYPKFWNSIRTNTEAIKGKAKEIEAAALAFKKLYPKLKPAEIYFTIGSFRSGGTIKDNMVLIGSEIAVGTPDIDVSEFQTKRLANVFSKQTLDHVVSLCIHEYVHTLQRGSMDNVLSGALKEGSCDFITELVLGRPLVTSYLTYGREHDVEVKARFKKEMFANNHDRWLYNTATFLEAGDMSYYMGYEICKAYYNKSKDKAKAIDDIIRLNFSNRKAVEAFLQKSGYYTEPIDKARIIKEYNKNLPYIVSMEPLLNGRKDVDSRLTEFRITFSIPMDPENYSVYHTKKGKEHFPFEKLIGMENENRTFVFKMDLKAGKEYEFILSDEEFSTPDGFKIRDKSFTVEFRTKDF